MYNVIDFICIISGVYLMYTGIVMKTQGKIISNVVLSKSVTAGKEDAIRDKDGFVQYLYRKLTVIGAIIVLSGIVSLVCDYQGGDEIVSFVTWLIFAAAIVAYGIVTNRAMKKFVLQNENSHTIKK